MLNFLWGGVNLLLSLSFTTIKGHVNGADTFVLNTAVNDKLLVSKGLDTELELEILLIALNLISNLSSISQKLENFIKIKASNEEIIWLQLNLGNLVNLLFDSQYLNLLFEVFKRFSKGIFIHCQC